MSHVLELDGRSLSLTDIERYQLEGGRVRLAQEARERMAASVDSVAAAVADERTCYGINTGFGAFANRRISQAEVRQLQYNLVRSHATGVGEPLSPAIVRRVLLTKANSLAQGVSGIRPNLVDLLLTMLERDVLPVIPSRGSVGASGDLAPLAHLALALIGEGEAERDGERLEGPAVLEALDAEPVELAAKEGLALLNGTQVSAAIAMEGLVRSRRLLETAIVVGSLSVEGLAGSFSPFDERIHAVRNQAGQQTVAAMFRSLLTESEIHTGHEDCDRVQDPYAVRCMPQVYGAAWDTLDHAESVLVREANGVSDNPLIFDGDALSGGNFHAAPVGFVADFMAVATAEIGSMSERRTDLLVRRVNPHLNMFLTEEPGLESGFMIAHVTAAALASENKTLAHPASVDSIPTSAGQEDHVSMAPWAGLKLLDICDNVARILAIELLAAAHAVEDQRPRSTTRELQRVYDVVEGIAPLERGDHRLDRKIEDLAVAVNEGRFAEMLPE